MELMVCQMLFFSTIIYENKTPDKSCVIIRSFLRDPSKLPNYLLLRQGQPCQSMGELSILPSLPLSLSPTPFPSTPSNTAHSTLNGSQKFAQSRNDEAASTNKGSFTPDELIKTPKETVGQVCVKKPWGEISWLTKKEYFVFLEARFKTGDSDGATWHQVLELKKHWGFDPQ